MLLGPNYSVTSWWRHAPWPLKRLESLPESRSNPETLIQRRTTKWGSELGTGRTFVQVSLGEAAQQAAVKPEKLGGWCIERKKGWRECVLPVTGGMVSSSMRTESWSAHQPFSPPKSLKPRFQYHYSLANHCLSFVPVYGASQQFTKHKEKNGIHGKWKTHIWSGTRVVVVFMLVFIYHGGVKTQSGMFRSRTKLEVKKKMTGTVKRDPKSVVKVFMDDACIVGRKKRRKHLIL